MTRRSTRTITVLSQAWLTTVPCRMRLGMSGTSLVLRKCGPVAFAEDGLDAGDDAAHLAHPGGVLQLAGSALEARVEDFLGQRLDLFAQFVGAAGADVGGFHPLHDDAS